MSSFLFRHDFRKKLLTNSSNSSIICVKEKAKPQTVMPKELYYKNNANRFGGGRYFFMDTINAISAIMKIIIYTYSISLTPFREMSA